MADQKIPYLTPQDLRKVQMLLDKDARRRQNTQNRYGPDDGVGQSPDVYIALTPYGGIGIPALIEGPDLGTASGTLLGLGDQPGYADCTIYRIDESAVPPAIDDTFVEQKRVYNLATDPIAGGTWVVVIRDKFGSWIVQKLLAERSNAKGVLDNTLAYQSSATMSVYEFSGAVETDTGENLVVYDWLLSSGQSINAGTHVIACRIGTVWYVVGAACV